MLSGSALVDGTLQAGLDASTLNELFQDEGLDYTVIASSDIEASYSLRMSYMVFVQGLISQQDLDSFTPELQTIWSASLTGK